MAIVFDLLLIGSGIALLIFVYLRCPEEFSVEKRTILVEKPFPKKDLWDQEWCSGKEIAYHFDEEYTALLETLLEELETKQ